MRLRLRDIPFLLLLIAVGLVAPSAFAEGAAEQDAKKLESDAMDVDYLSLDYKAAKKKLDEALKKCGAGTDKCSAPVVANLHRDLGVILITLKNTKAGSKEFAAAFAADRNVDIGKDFLANPDIAKAWETTRKAAGITGAPTPPPPAPGRKAPAVDADAQGNMKLATMIAPVGFVFPIVVSAPDDEEITEVKFSYKSASMDKYKTIDATKQNGKFVTQIDCADMQFTGEIKFYLRGYDVEKDEVDHFGTQKKPATIKVVDALPENVAPPTFPDGKVPEKCVMSGDCPPGFPCDKHGAAKTGEGGDCSEDQDCEPSLSCVLNPAGSRVCHDTAAAETKAAPITERMWLGLHLELDSLFLGAGTDICAQSTWACTKNGVDYTLAETATSTRVNIPGGGGLENGGFSLSTFRVLGAFDYFLFRNFSVGARLGWAFNGNNSSESKFLAVHGELLRGQYFFRDADPKASPLRPYALVAVGIGEYDAAISGVNVVAANNSKNNETCAGGQSCIRDVTAYRLAGQGFAAFGGGAWYYLSPKIALDGALKILVPFPASALGLSLEVGIKYAL